MDAWLTMQVKAADILDQIYRNRRMTDWPMQVKEADILDQI